MSRINKYAVETISSVELCNFLEKFKTNILGSLSEQIDTLKVKNKQNAAFPIFFPKCRNKHAMRECPLDLRSVETYVICEKNNDTKEFPSILGLKASYQEETIPNQIDSLCFITKRP